MVFLAHHRDSRITLLTSNLCLLEVPQLPPVSFRVSQQSFIWTFSCLGEPAECTRLPVLTIFLAVPQIFISLLNSRWKP